jgi:amino acid permease
MTDPSRGIPGKIILMIMLFMFTFVTMVGGNPLKDAYGFRYWKNPGPISEYYGTGHSAQLRAFLASILGAAFAVAGPDMLSLIVSFERGHKAENSMRSDIVCRGYQPPKSLAWSLQERLR